MKEDNQKVEFEELVDNGPAITLLRHAAEHIGRIFAEKEAEYASIDDRNDLTAYGKDNRSSDKRWGERIQQALEGMALKANQLDADFVPLERYREAMRQWNAAIEREDAKR